jgi:hypothetical protein
MRCILVVYKTFGGYMAKGQDKKKEVKKPKKAKVPKV